MSLNKKLNHSEAGYLGYLKSKEKREAKNKNKGNGRASRRERYRLKKTY